jgi:hypothetical protein
VKLDISKAFDSVRWDYLVSVIRQKGFPPKWCNWVAALLSSSTSRVLLNRITLPSIPHGRGQRQGDPLSPLLFVLAFDPHQHIIAKATDLNLLSKFDSKVERFRASLYADNAVVFISPMLKDISNLA